MQKNPTSTRLVEREIINRALSKIRVISVYEFIKILILLSSGIIVGIVASIISLQFHDFSGDFSGEFFYRIAMF